MLNISSIEIYEVDDHWNVDHCVCMIRRDACFISIVKQLDYSFDYELLIFTGNDSEIQIECICDATVLISYTFVLREAQPLIHFNFKHKNPEEIRFFRTPRPARMSAIDSQFYGLWYFWN